VGHILRHGFRWLIFKIGDTRWEGWRYFPMIVGWNQKKPLIRGSEILEAMKVVQPGDVPVIRHDGFASNIGIPGCFIHGAIYVGDGECIEALSDDEGGVTNNSLVDILHADLALILRPKLSPEERQACAKQAWKIHGAKYDYLFDFNVEDELRAIEKNPKIVKRLRICCTEVILFSYLKHKEYLHLWTSPNDSLLTKILRFLGLMIGKSALTADAIALSEMEIVWASKSCTEQAMKERGAPEALVAKVKRFWKSLEA
jgi:hypothetical protein